MKIIILCLILSACTPATELLIAEVIEDVDKEIIKEEEEKVKNNIKK
jgi:hypothetical protein